MERGEGSMGHLCECECVCGGGGGAGGGGDYHTLLF